MLAGLKAFAITSGLTCFCLLQIWATGDVSHADAIFAKDVELYNIIYGEPFKTFTSMLGSERV
jgi:hypothetical protein